MTHAEACHAAFDRAGLWHLVGEGRRLAHYMRTGRWMPSGSSWNVREIPGDRRDATALTTPAPWESYG